ncbi:MAG: threonine ammonia-lyase [Gammaproteobacteria bacterium]
MSSSQGSALTLADVQAARRRIADGVAVTPCAASIPLSEICGCHIYCKADYLQRTGSFKERGARNALLLLNDEQRRRGVIAASAGNHALGLAYHGQLLGIPVNVVMPTYAPLIKVATCRRLGANVIVHGTSFVEARAHADELVKQRGYTYIHGFDDPAVIAGQGTMGLEILEQVPNVDAIVAPIGGGGLIAGLGLAVKSLRPNVKLIGVEAEHAPSYTAALAAGKPVMSDTKPTLADGLAVGRVGDNAFAIARRYVDRVVAVDEEALALAVFRLIELEKSVIEGAAASPLAAFLRDGLKELRGQHVVLTLCGGNIDLNILDRIIEVGLVADGRLCRFGAVISDRPGGLARLAALIASTGASIKDIAHDRTFSGPDVATVRTICVAETSDRAHIEKLYRTLRDGGIDVIPDTPRA